MSASHTAPTFVKKQNSIDNQGKMEITASEYMPTFSTVKNEELETITKRTQNDSDASTIPSKYGITIQCEAKGIFQFYFLCVR